MRVTENTNFDTVRGAIHRSKSRMENYQMQASTMKKLNTPSDDPIASSKVLEMRTEKVNNDQFQSNAHMAMMFLENSDHALSDLNEVIMRAREIAIGQASGPSSSEATRLGVAEEVEQLYLQSVATANRRVGDRYLFAGYKTNKPPINADGLYSGDDGQMMTEISRDVYIAMNLPGMEVFNTNPKFSQDAKQLGYGPSRDLAVSELDPEMGTENINLFNELAALRIALLTGDMGGVRDTLERFDQLQQRLLSMRAKIGSRVQGIQAAATTIDKTSITNANLSSTLEDVDMAQVMSDLAKEETIYKSALASSKHLIQPTLLDFLR